MRSLCGCRALEDLRVSAHEEGAKRSIALSARDRQKRWGCTAAGHKVPTDLPPDLAEVSWEWAETVGLAPLRLPGDPPRPETPPTRTCPFARAYQPTEWQREILRAHRLMVASKGGLRFAEILGRAPTARDIEGLDALVRAQGQAVESDIAIQRAEAEAQRQAKT